MATAPQFRPSERDANENEESVVKKCHPGRKQLITNKEEEKNKIRRINYSFR